MITILLTVFHVIFCLVLIFVILVQGGRGQGMTGNAFGSGNVQSLFGTRAADFLTKATSVSAILFIFTCLGLNMVEARKSKSLLESGRPTSPIDVDALRKALQNVKDGKVVETTSSAPIPVTGGPTSGTKAGEVIPVPGKPPAGTPVVTTRKNADGSTVVVETQSTPFNESASGDASKKPS